MDNKNLNIREFEPRDYDRIISLWESAGLPVRTKGRDSKSSICNQVKMTNVTLLVAESEGEIIGTVLGTHDSRKGWVNRLAVDIKSRRKNIASRLISEVEQWFQSNGLDVFACVIESDNKVSMELFSKLGYKEWDVRYFSKRKDNES